MALLASHAASLSSQVQSTGLQSPARRRSNWPWKTPSQPARRGYGSGQCQAARNVPPEKGRGRYARKAATEGLQRIMKGKVDMEGWTEVASTADLQEGKNKAIIHNNKGYVLVKLDNVLHAIEANCTSCKFPVIEGKVVQEEDGELNISCPLCHTKFSLVDGRVITYCPKDGPLQWFIGTLKQKATPEAAKVFPARISNSGRVYVRFANVQVI